MKKRTHFNKNCTWMTLRGYYELTFLKEAMRKYEYEGQIIEIYETGERIKHGDLWTSYQIQVVIRRPGFTETDKHQPLYGEDYRKWEKVKSYVYLSRRTTR